jgi:hypothetical protein
MLAQASTHGIAAEPDTSRQLQEKAGGVTPAGLFSWSKRAFANPSMLPTESI